MFDEEKPVSKGAFVLGEDLYDFSVEDLRQRLDMLKVEITRVEGTLEQKRTGLETAAAIFGKS